MNINRHYNVDAPENNGGEAAVEKSEAQLDAEAIALAVAKSKEKVEEVIETTPPATTPPATEEEHFVFDPTDDEIPKPKLNKDVLRDIIDISDEDDDEIVIGKLKSALEEKKVMEAGLSAMAKLRQDQQYNALVEAPKSSDEEIYKWHLMNVEKMSKEDADEEYQELIDNEKTSKISRRANATRTMWREHAAGMEEQAKKAEQEAYKKLNTSQSELSKNVLDILAKSDTFVGTKVTKKEALESYNQPIVAALKSGKAFKDLKDPSTLAQMLQLWYGRNTFEKIVEAKGKSKVVRKLPDTPTVQAPAARAAAQVASKINWADKVRQG